MSGKPPVLGTVEAVIREAPLLLKVEDEGPDLMLSDLEYVRTLSSRRKEVVKVVHATGDNSCGVRAFSLGSRTKLVTMK